MYHLYLLTQSPNPDDGDRELPEAGLSGDARLVPNEVELGLLQRELRESS